jgi:hypothetical protein
MRMLSLLWVQVFVGEWPETALRPQACEVSSESPSFTGTHARQDENSTGK